ncbi:hypothetical protein ACFL6X_07675 [Candidatus Latescibacterota bacterium]
MATRHRRRRPNAWYALRRTLPTWSFDVNLRELVEQLPRYRVDEVIIKVDTEEFTHGQPPLAWVRRYQDNLFRVREAMEGIGVVYSLNPWITVGHNDRGRDGRKQIRGLQTTVGHDGSQCTCCACPLSDAWRGHVAKVWTLYAQTEPHVIWIEDDIRTFNHQPVRYGCFCPLHMKRFSQRAGRKVTRQELVAAILKPGKPHRWRREFLDMQAEVMADTVGFLAQTVHAASHSTCLGLMSSGPRQHCLEGRRWDDFSAAMADGQPLYSRPPMGNYSEASLRGFYYSHDSMKITRHCMPADTIEQTEVENFPFTQYSKSAVFTFLEMAISFAYGSHGVTMNLYDHAGTPMEAEPAFGAMLRAKKGYLNGLAARAQESGTIRGVQLLFEEKESHSRRLERGADGDRCRDRLGQSLRDSPRGEYSDLVADGAHMMQLLESHGIPTTYEQEKVVATCGQQVRSLADKQIEELLSSAILMDGPAAQVLTERGFGKLIGLRSVEASRCIDELGGPYSAEEYFNRRFGGADGKYLTLTVPGLGGRPSLCEARLARGAEVVSRLVDPDARRLPVSAYAFQNRLGGRVFVHLLDLDTAYGVAFNHTFRAQMLQHAVRWLSRSRPALLARGDGVYPLALRRDLKDGRCLLGLFNLTLDPWSEVELELEARREPGAIEVLTPGGKWERTKKAAAEKKGGRVLLRYRGAVPFDEPLFLTVSWK